jgi:hypothetical protein
VLVGVLVRVGVLLAVGVLVAVPVEMLVGVGVAQAGQGGMPFDFPCTLHMAPVVSSTSSTRMVFACMGTLAQKLPLKVVVP